MRNPFQYGGVVSGESFCNRTKEVAELKRAIENAEKLFVYSERRLGKTSLIRKVLRELPKEEFLTVYIDLWPTDGETSFVLACAKAFSEAMATTTDKLLQTAKTFFSRLVPSVSANDDGKPVVTFGFDQKRPDVPLLEEILAMPAQAAEKEGKRVVVVFDEFQQILEYESDVVERLLRSSIQHQTDVAYVFCGSRKHLIRQMFMDSQRPMYRSGSHYPLGLITEDHWQGFIAEKFTETGKRIGAETISAICRLTEGHPFYTQHLCHPLWELCETGGEVKPGMIDQATTLLLDRESYAFMNLWESLPRNSRRLLKGIAAEAPGIQVFSSEFLRKYQLGSSSNAQRAVEQLLKKDVIDKEEGSVVIPDRFFRLWINSKQ
ncbi:MAG: ATP-binding protein [Kiritimatiellales bacterium]|nr:ATP-binding protein [Kiritimatiellales bacterium]MCF7864680.1 ATP-binding protein [Kiritimatiellales bacterium]